MTAKHSDATRSEDEAPKVVIRDRRRIDPETGAPRPTVEPADGPEAPGASGTLPDAPGAAPAAAGADAPPTSEATLQAQLEERTADLQRVTAEYANYRKRVERDRQLVVEQATGTVLSTLLPILDDLDRARAHGDLTGAFGAVAEQLTSTLTKLGLTSFGNVGDPFDPTWHEAVTHSVSSDVTASTCVAILRKGYAFRDRLLRPALVGVADPIESAEPAAGDPTGAGPIRNASPDRGATSAKSTSTPADTT